MKKSAKKRGMVVYKSYSFVSKDPIIDVMRTVASDKRLTNRAIAVKSGVSPGTLRGWFLGGVKRPQFSTVAAVLPVLGVSKISFRAGKPYLE